MHERLLTIIEIFGAGAKREGGRPPSYNHMSERERVKLSTRILNTRNGDDIYLSIDEVEHILEPIVFFSLRVQ